MGHRRSVEERPAGNHFFRLFDVGKNLLGRLACAARHSGKGQRSRHQPQEIPAFDAVERRGQARRELVADQLVQIRAVVLGERPPEFWSVGRFHR